MTKYPFSQHDPGDEDANQRVKDLTGFLMGDTMFLGVEWFDVDGIVQGTNVLDDPFYTKGDDLLVRKPRALGFSEKHICRFYVVPGSMGERRANCECGKAPDRPLCGLDFRYPGGFNLNKDGKE